jgi:hypothetical protein
MRTIKIDDEVWETLKKAAIPLQDEPNDALRRLLGLPDRNAPRPAASGHNSPQKPRPSLDRSKIEATIVEIIRERGGRTSIKDPISGFNIYEEVVARLRLPREILKELTPTGENRWRAEVGFARKNLEQRGVIAPTGQSGRGVWKLK